MGLGGFLGRKASSLLILFCFLATACSIEGPAPLRLGTNVWPGYEPFYLARTLNYFSREEVSLKEFTSATEVIRSFRNGAIDAAALTLDEVLLLLQHGVDLKIILVCDASHGGDVILSWPPAKSLADLKGKRVGVENTALGAYVLTRALQQQGMAPSDIHLVSAEVNEHERFFLSGKVDGVVTFEPVRSKILEVGGVELFTSKAIPYEILDVVVVRSSYLKKNKKQVRQLLAGWFKALWYLESYPREAAKMMSSRLKLSPDKVLESFDGLRLPSLSENHAMLKGTKHSVKEIGGKLATVMLEQGLLGSKPEPGDMISLIIEEVSP